MQNGLNIIDLAKTMESLENAKNLLAQVAEKRRQVLVVGISKHVRDLVPEYASSFGENQMPYVNHRWLGGTLTNWPTIKRTLKTLEKLESMMSDEKFFKSLARKEQLSLERKHEKNL